MRAPRSSVSPHEPLRSRACTHLAGSCCPVAAAAAAAGFGRLSGAGCRVRCRPPRLDDAAAGFFRSAARQRASRRRHRFRSGAQDRDLIAPAVERRVVSRPAR
uniref:Uncharacterized protein n=1 Tax=Setaria viridis TaxID=4556 RepID=A0A4U6UI25_SETVI|nr:hypothetical protein SEVIR_5G099300v2 [Setaria viridis]